MYYLPQNNLKNQINKRPVLFITVSHFYLKGCETILEKMYLDKMKCDFV